MNCLFISVFVSMFILIWGGAGVGGHTLSLAYLLRGSAPSMLPYQLLIGILGGETVYMPAQCNVTVNILNLKSISWA